VCLESLTLYWAAHFPPEPRLLYQRGIWGEGAQAPSFFVATLVSDELFAMAVPERVKNKMKELGLQGVNKPKKTPSHESKSHVVMASEGGEYKLIRFGQQGVSGSPKKEGESEAYRKRRESFKARHAKNIAKGKLSAAWWANREKWTVLAALLTEELCKSFIA
jgi:hypothetical protein